MEEEDAREKLQLEHLREEHRGRERDLSHKCKIHQLDGYIESILTWSLRTLLEIERALKALADSPDPVRLSRSRMHTGEHYLGFTIPEGTLYPTLTPPSLESLARECLMLSGNCLPRPFDSANAEGVSKGIRLRFW